ncbi:hypothetical protein A2863_00440 [Candidatus Woesebacteria bacterium RIFCSPHIGHO2_01_FULL_38_9b]|uniref:bAvd-like domain-containing protein n=1 Tax=Candidatus Woesebacteria bacterium RIFCSPHIGHO2_01_FULL_38_9b TaxID=1802493 RepID=A0A1F7Y4Y9_9BACT|nr:MAG: hypothetical protein A2863_00440 [Candidatus Woesebacteria bacterium RIFCSPHIGHO2_01_FULL_38_9b]
MRSYDTYKRIVDVTIDLPKRWKYGIGLSIEQSILSCLEELVMAKNAPRSLKAAYLIRASSHLEVTTLKMRLLLELKLANETKIFQIQANLEEIGRMLGGWLKSTQSL